MGKVYLVGAGPGAADLITLRGAALLQRADVVFYDALVHPDTLALAVGAKKIAVGKRAGAPSTEQRFINRALVEAGLKHETVVRLKGGDPMLFGRAQEELDALLAAGIEVEVVPGVTAALAAAADLRVPLTQRGLSRSVTFVTARVAPGETQSGWCDAVAGSDTTALYMAAGQASELSAHLIAAGVPPATPVALVENASLPDCRRIFTTVAGLAQANAWDMSGPAIILLGEVFRQTIPAAQTSAPEDGEELRLHLA